MALRKGWSTLATDTKDLDPKTLRWAAGELSDLDISQNDYDITAREWKAMADEIEKQREERAAAFRCDHAEHSMFKYCPNPPGTKATK